MFDESLRIALIYVHVLAAAVWIGGTIVVAAVLVPVSRRMQPPGAGPRFLREAARRFSRIGWALTVVLILSGIGILDRSGIDFDRLTDSGFWGTETGKVLAIKVVLVAVMVGLSYVHDFVIGPRVADALEQAGPGQPPPAAAIALRKRLLMLARVNLLVVLAIAALGVMLFRGVPG